MSPDPVNHIPAEIISFFRENVGEILLVKGPPGSGKTMLSLECMKSLCQKKKGITIFPRMDADQLASEYGWLVKGSDDHNLLAFHGNTKMADPNWFKREFDSLNQKNDEGIGFMLFDPINAITEQYENPERKMKEIVSLVQGSNVSAIIVQEQEGTTYLDHLAGGVVRLFFDEKEGRRFRALTFEKMRGVEVRNSNYLFTLHDGKFRSFKPWSVDTVAKGEWVPIEDTTTHFSSGIQDLDRILVGGFKRGSYNILDVDDNIMFSEYLLLLRPVLLNFLCHDQGVLMVTPAGEHPESIRGDLMEFIDGDILSEKLYFLDYFSASSAKEYIIPMMVPARKDATQHKGKEIYQKLRGNKEKPYLDFVGLDTMEYFIGESLTMKQLLTGVSQTKVTKTLGIGIVKPGLKIGQGIRNMSDIYLRMIRIHSIPCFFGIKPETTIFAILPCEELGFPNLELIPLT